MTPSVDFQVAAPVQELLTCVFAGVGDEGAGHGEGFAAAVTHVGLLSGVPPHVVRQRAGLGEALPAAVTHVRLLPAVLPATTQPLLHGQHPQLSREGSVPCSSCCRSGVQQTAEPGVRSCGTKLRAWPLWDQHICAFHGS